MPPALPDTLGHFRCRLLTDLTKIIGDHSVWFCAVESTAVGLCDDKTSPLVYWQQKYCRL
jgi:flavin reductase (DIM6/NTAB) family NADH-FMN oxidoreductase RutF